MSSQSADAEHRLAEEQYFPVLTGTVLDGHEIEAVVVDLAELLQIPEEKAGDLLQGKPSRLRKRLSKKKADRLQTRLLAIGVGCYMEPVEQQPASEQDATKGSMAGVRDVAPGAMAVPESPVQASDEQGQERLSLDLSPADVPSSSDQADLSLEPEEVVADHEAAPRQEQESSPPDPVDAAAGQPAGASAVFPTGSSSPDMTENPGQFFEQPSQRREPARDEKHKDAATAKKLGLGLAALLLLTAGGWGAMRFIAGGEAPSETASAPERRPPADPMLAKTLDRMRSLASSVKVWMIQYGSGFDPHQVTLPRMQADLQLSPSDMQDAWGTPLGYRPEVGSYSVVSAGPDREFESADDLGQKVDLE